jgi:hypothetical protein
MRYASLAVSERMDGFDFSEFLGSDRWLGPALKLLSSTVLSATVVFPLLANRHLWRRGRRMLRGWLPPCSTDRAWLKGYARVCFVAAAIVFSIAPTTIMAWQGLILFHAAILPVIFWVGALGRSRLASRVMAGTRAYAVVEVAFLIALTLGGVQYRCGGHTGSDGFGFSLAYDSPIFRDLHIQQTCPWPVNVRGGWWPDVLPKPRGMRAK